MHGRRPGRGLRPGLLLPKILAVGVLVGGLASSIIVCVYVDGRMARGAEPDLPLWSVELLRAIFLSLVVPATAAAILLGILLTWMHGPGLMLRQRWLQVKLAVLLVAAPAGHIMMVALLGRARDAAEAGATDAGPLRQFAMMAAAVLAGVVVLMTLGRHKPRLGQNWARTFARLQAKRNTQRKPDEPR